MWWHQVFSKEICDSAHMLNAQWYENHALEASLNKTNFPLSETGLLNNHLEKIPGGHVIFLIFEENRILHIPFHIYPLHFNWRIN